LGKKNVGTQRIPETPQFVPEIELQVCYGALEKDRSAEPNLSVRGME